MIEDLIKQNLKYVESGSFNAVPSGFVELDRITGGWQKSELIVIAARPAMGKTAFVLSCARKASIDFNKPVVVFTLEMSNTQIVNRLVSSEVDIELKKLRKANFEEIEWQKIHAGIRRLEDAPLIIDDTPSLDIDDFLEKCRKLKEEKDIQLIIVDYIQLMRGKGSDGKRINDRWQEIGSISRALKALAKELNVPIIALSQLSRAVESRPGASKRPMLSDLAESGSIEQDADMVLFLYRPEYYGMEVDEDNNLTKGKAEVIVAKHRNGDTGIARLNFIASLVKFDNIDFKEEFENSFSNLKTSAEFNKSNNFIIRPSRLADIDDEPPF